MGCRTPEASRRSERAFTEDDLLAGVDETNAFERERLEQAHDSHTREGGDGSDVGVGVEEREERADAVEIRVGQPDPLEVERVDDGLQRS